MERIVSVTTFSWAGVSELFTPYPRPPPGKKCWVAMAPGIHGVKGRGSEGRVQGPPDGFSSKFGAGTRVLLFYPFQFRPFPSDASVLRRGESCTAYNVINTRLPLLRWLSVCLSVCLVASEPAVSRSPS